MTVTEKGFPDKLYTVRLTTRTDKTTFLKKDRCRSVGGTEKGEGGKIYSLNS